MPTITFAFKGKVTMNLLNWNYNYNHRISKYNNNIYLKTLLHKKIHTTEKNIKKLRPHKNTLMKLATLDSMHISFQDRVRVYSQSIKQFSNMKQIDAKNLQEK